MTTQLARVQSSGGVALMPTSGDWSTMMQMADAVIKSGLAPEAIKTPAAALIIMEKGRELSLPPLYALSNIAVIKGKPVAGAELLLAVIYRDHGDNALKVVHTDNSGCTVAYKRRLWDGWQEYSFTIEDARTAGLMGNQTWQKYPAAMCRARCISAVARLAFPDSIGGLYTADEMGAEVIVSDEGAVELAPEAPPVGQSLRGSIGEIEAQRKRQPATQSAHDEYHDLRMRLEVLTGKAPREAPADITAGELEVWIRKANEKHDAALQEQAAANEAQAAAERDPDPEPIEGEVLEPTDSPMGQLVAYFAQQKFPGSSHPQHILNTLKKEGVKGPPTAENLTQCKQALERHYIEATPNGWTPGQGVANIKDAYPQDDLDDEDPFAD